MANPADTYTIEQFISVGKSYDISYNKAAILEKIATDVYIASHNIFHDYKAELLDASVSVKLTDADFMKYQFNPRRLAFDVYGYTDLYFIIMILWILVS